MPAQSRGRWCNVALEGMYFSIGHVAASLRARGVGRRQGRQRGDARPGDSTHEPQRVAKLERDNAHLSPQLPQADTMSEGNLRGEKPLMAATRGLVQDV